MNEIWRPSLTCSGLNAGQGLAVGRALVVTYERVIGDPALERSETLVLRRVLGPSVERLRVSVTHLEESIRERDDGPIAPSVSASSALRGYRPVWGLLGDGFRLAVRIEKGRGQTEAASLLAALFPNAPPLSFLSKTPIEAWTAAGERIETLRSDAALVVIRRHHLEEQVEQVERAHRSFGRALGATGSLVPVAVVEVMSVRDALAECTTNLCAYVRRACALEDADVSGSDLLVTRLLSVLDSVARFAPRTATLKSATDEEATASGDPKPARVSAAPPANESDAAADETG